MSWLKKAWRAITGTIKAIIKNPITAILGVGLAIFNPGLGLKLLSSLVISSVFTPEAPRQEGISNSDPGNRQQLPPATNNKLPVVYGTAWVSPIITDAVISSDNQTMWYVMPLCEAVDAPDYFTAGEVWWGDNRLTFDNSDPSRVISWTNLDGQTDTAVNGYMNVYLFSDGSFSPMPGWGTDTAITVMQDAQIPAANRWNGNNEMSRTVFAIVRLKYNQDAGITGLNQLRVELTSTLTRPGSCMRDYLTNTRYGAGLDPATLGSGFGLLDLYSDVQIPYTTTSNTTAYISRYRFDGMVNTSQSILTNLQVMADCSDCFIQFKEDTAQWNVIVNKAYDQYPVAQTIDQLFSLDSNNIIGGIRINPQDLNSTYNSAESAFPNYKSRDQLDYVYQTTPASVRNSNEPDNQLKVSYNLVNNSVRAQYLTNRKLEQVRSDLIVEMTADYSAIQVDAGDVVKVTWDFAAGQVPSPGAYYWVDKLFRVIRVEETKLDTGELTARLQLSEYDTQVYDDFTIDDYDITDILGITNPTIISLPAAPTFTSQAPSTAVPNFRVNTTVPITGHVTAMEFWFGPSSDVNTMILWETQYYNSGPLFPNGLAISTIVSGLDTGTWYWRVRARNNTRISEFSAEASISWLPSPTGTIVGQNFQTQYTPPFLALPRTTTGTVTYTNSTFSLYGTSGAAQVDFVNANTDSDSNFVNNTWRVGSSSVTGFADISYTGVTTTVPYDAGNHLYWEGVTNLVINNASALVPVRFKDNTGTVYQAPPARINFVYQQQGNTGVNGNFYIFSQPRIYFESYANVVPGDITVTGGRYSRIQQTLTTLPTVTVQGETIIPSQTAVSISEGNIRWRVDALQNFSTNTILSFNVTGWHDPIIDAGYGPRGADGTSPVQLDLNLTAAAFYRNNVGALIPPEINAVLEVQNLSNTFIPSWSVTNATGFNPSGNNYQYTFSPDGSDNSILLQVSVGGFIKTAIVPVIAPGATGNAGPQGQRGFIPLAYIPMFVDPRSATNQQFTQAWIDHTNLTPIESDAGSFYWTSDARYSSSRIYNSATQVWDAAVLQVPGSVIVDGSIRSTSLAAADIYTLNFRSTNAVFSDNTSPGFWMRASDGSARFGGSVSIGGDLTVDGLITGGALNGRTVGLNNMIPGSISSYPYRPTLGSRVQYSPTNLPSTWPDNTRAIVAQQSILPTGDTEGSKILLSISGQVYSSSPSNMFVELWADRPTTSFDSIITSMAVAGQSNNQPGNTAIVGGRAGFLATLQMDNDTGAIAFTQYPTTITDDILCMNTYWVQGTASRLSYFWPSVRGYGRGGRIYTVDQWGWNDALYMRYYDPSDNTFYYVTQDIYGACWHLVAQTYYGGEVICGQSGALYRSHNFNNGTRWKDDSGTTKDLYAVASRYRRSSTPTVSRLVAVGAAGAVTTALVSSTNRGPFRWSLQTALTTEALRAVAHNLQDGLSATWVAVGDAGTIIRSGFDGDGGWTLRTSGTNLNLTSIVYDVQTGFWFAAGGNDLTRTVLVSDTDGLTWTEFSSTLSRTMFTGHAMGTGNTLATTYSQAVFGGEAQIIQAPVSGSTAAIWTGAITEVSNYTRLWSQGSNPTNPFDTNPVASTQQLTNNQVVGVFFYDRPVGQGGNPNGYTPGVVTRYIFVLGSLNNTSTTYITVPLLAVQEIKA